MNAIGETLSVEDLPGVYLIRCRSNNATYTGSSLQIRKRLQLHTSLLRLGNSLVQLLQHDWNTYGEDQFEFFVCHKPANELCYWEELMTLLTDSLDDRGGFNKMLGNRVWSLSSRIKNTEQKLIKQRKFFRLPASSNSRLASDYIRTFCQGNIPFFKFDPLLQMYAQDSITKQLKLKEQLVDYHRFMQPISRK